MTTRIAMWSGPRNLSTAMMYSFAARGDCRVVDEPFYAAYLAATGADHPMRDAVLASQSSDPDEVAKSLFSTVSEPLFYQKHMTPHMLPEWPLMWMEDMQNVFLIRHPARVVASYAAKREAPTLEDIGFVQQCAIFAQLGGVVIDSTDIRAQPEMMLQRLCAAIGVPWDPAMLHWPEGGHPADGVWARHWYGAVHASTGFAGAEGPLPDVEGELADVLAQALPIYEDLWKKRL